MKNNKDFKNVKKTNFKDLFYPKSIAIVGASKNKLGGSKFLLALESSGYIADGGKVFLVNPKINELFNLPVYPSIKHEKIPKPIDLVIIAVSAQIVPKIVLECNKIAKFGVIYSSGFAESGNNKLDEELKSAIKIVDTRFVGPNGLGIMNPHSKISIYPNWGLFKGNISYIAQSGGTMARLYLSLGDIGLGFHNVVSIGNSYDITTSELLDHFFKDPITKTIALYLESIPNGKIFMKNAKKITSYKPIVLWKGGQTKRGINASFSHTGSITGSYDVWKTMCKQTGILLADHFEMFNDLIQVVNIRPLVPDSLNVVILVAGGGIAVEFTDLFQKAGLKIPDLEKETVNKLKKIFPAVNTSFKNPVDLGEYGYNPYLFSQALKVVLNDNNVDTVVFVREPERFEIISKMLNIEDAGELTLKSISKIVKKSSKPVFCNLSPNRNIVDAYKIRYEFSKKMIKAGVPIINIPTNIPKIIFQLFNYGKFLKNINNN